LNASRITINLNIK